MKTVLISLLFCLSPIHCLKERGGEISGIQCHHGVLAVLCGVCMAVQRHI